jgi:hypothetical protein
VSSWIISEPGICTDVRGHDPLCFCAVEVSFGPCDKVISTASLFVSVYKNTVLTESQFYPSVCHHVSLSAWHEIIIRSGDLSVFSRVSLHIYALLYNAVST